MSERASPPERAASEPLRAGREALSRHAWVEAFELLSQADREGDLAGEDLEALAEAAYIAKAYGLRSAWPP